MNFQTIVLDTWNVLMPISCAGCGRRDISLCEECRSAPQQAFAPQLVWREALWGVPVWACVPYEGTWQRVVIAAKDGGRHGLFRYAAHQVAHALQRVVGLEAGVFLVPMPSSYGGWIRRGIEPADLLARHSARVIEQTRGVRPTVARGLRRAPGVAALTEAIAGPVARKHRGRTERLRHRPRVRARPWLRGHQVVIIDDVVTTGASMEAAAAAISAVGGRVVAGVAWAAPPR